MGSFYGNITNTSRTQFQFDKIYPNRYEMDLNAARDGVYLGRYVLVEYDDEYHLDTFLRVQIKNNKAYYNPIGGTGYVTLLTKGMVHKGEIIYEADNTLTPDTGLAPTNCSFYQITSEFNENSSEPATFTDINALNSYGYTANYNIDLGIYAKDNNSRGYDSTVWQKVYSGGVEKYVMIAELNTVVPMFDVLPDAPTMNPIVPHFDTQSTDVYYKLHWQTPWGFRVAEDNNLSDATTVWTTYEYDEDDNTHTKYEEPKNAAIFYNKAAFKPYGDNGVITKKYTLCDDEIKVAPTGISGNLYNTHEGASADMAVDYDIQEMTIHLPSIGNMMSDAWDIIHGDDRKDSTGDDHPSLQGRLNAFSAMKKNTIAIKRSSDGTLVGTKINGNTNKTVTNILNETLSTSYDSDDAWIKTSINTAELNNSTKQNGIAIHHTFTAAPDTTTTSNKNTDAVASSNSSDKIDLYTPIVDKAGHVVGKNTETVTLPYGFKTITVDNASTVTTNVAAAPDSVVAETTQDTLTLTPGNAWIHLGADADVDTITVSHEVNTITVTDKTGTDLNDGTDTITIQDTKFDNAGHVTHNQKHTYTLPYGFKTITTNGRGAAVDENATETPVTTNVVADTTQDSLAINSGNKWIRIDTDAQNDAIVIQHDIHTTTNTDNTTDWTQTEKDTTIPTVTYQYDEAGHYVSHHTENYKLPFGYGKIKGDNSTSTAATATYDELSIVTGDDWLTSTVSTDAVTLTHDFTAVEDTTSSTNKNTVTENKDTIALYTPIVDAKGHVVGKNTETITLPYGYKTFTGDNNVSTSADSTQDTMSVTGDNWVQTTVSNDSIAFAHIGPVSGTAAEVDSETPAFGATFTIADHYFDTTGHKFTSKSHTVKIPEPSLTNGTGNVVTGLNLVQSTGALTETKNNISNLLLTDYSKKTNNADIADTDALGDALSKLQTQIHDTETVINNLEYSNESTENFITKITQTDGQIAVERAAAGTLVLGSSYAKSGSGGTISTTDSLNTAIGKLEKNIEIEKDRITTLLGGEDINEAFDTIKEVADWMSANDSGADKVIDDIATLKGDKDTEGSVDYKIAHLDVEDAAETGKYVSAIGISDGKLSITKESLPTYAVTTGTANGTIAFNNTNVPVYGLGSAAYTNSDVYASASVLEDYLVPYGEDQKTVAQVFAIVASLQSEIQSLRQEIETLKSYHSTDVETPEGEEEIPADGEIE